MLPSESALLRRLYISKFSYNSKEPKPNSSEVRKSVIASKARVEFLQYFPVIFVVLPVADIIGITLNKQIE